MRGAIPPLPQYVVMEWCLIKHRDFNLLEENYPALWTSNGWSKTVLISVTITTLLAKYCQDNNIKKHEMSRTCSKHWGSKEFVQNFGWKSPSSYTTWEDNITILK
jgi:hypothetical protein